MLRLFRHAVEITEVTFVLLEKPLISSELGFRDLEKAGSPECLSDKIRGQFDHPKMRLSTLTSLVTITSSLIISPVGAKAASERIC